MSNETPPATAAALPKRQSFAALHHRGFRYFFVGNATAMMADNCEHVISYYVMTQKFHSPMLQGFAVIAHWVPFLLFSGYAGALAERFDKRRMIQIGMLLFMCVSLTWGVLFATDSLKVWQAVVLLIVHGFAGVLWTAPSQLLIHDIVTPEHLPSAIRLGATSRYVGTLLGPAVGSGLMALLGPSRGIFINAAIYLPMFMWLWYAPRAAQGQVARAAVHGLAEALATLRSMRGNATIFGMTMLAGAASLFIGSAYQAVMPIYAIELGHGQPGVAYWALLAADASGALIGALVLEGRGLLMPRARTALMLAMCWCVALGTFALSHTYALSVAALFCAGFLELSFSAMAQALVQMSAPAQLRGPIIGTFVMIAMGLRFVSGFTVGVLGTVVGVHVSLGSSAAALFVTVLGLLLWQTRRPLTNAPQPA